MASPLSLLRCRRLPLPSLCSTRRPLLLLRSYGSTADTMSTLDSGVDVRGADFRRNAADMEALVLGLRGHLSAARLGGGAKAVERHVSRGKLVARDRVSGLLDPGSPFLELSPLAGHELYEGDNVASGGIITGIGRVCGVEVMVVVNDATVKGGTYYPMTVKKHLRAQEIAAQNRLPCVYLVDSGGAFLPLQVRESEERAGGEARGERDARRKRDARRARWFARVG